LMVWTKGLFHGVYPLPNHEESLPNSFAMSTVKSLVLLGQPPRAHLA